MSDPRTEQGTELLRRVAAAYAHCKTYQDTGLRVVSYQRHSGEHWKSEFPFETAFARPDRFRFVYGERNAYSERGRKLIWSAGGSVQNWPRAADHTWSCSSLAGALDSEDEHIAALLFPEQFTGTPLVDFVVTKEPQHVVLDGIGCWRVEVEGHPGRDALWVDEQRLLVRRIEHSGYGIDDYDIISTITFEPQFDLSVSEAQLTLERPYDGHQTPWSYVFLPAALLVVAGVFGASALKARLPWRRLLVWLCGAVPIAMAAQAIADVVLAVGGGWRSWQRADGITTAVAIGLTLLIAAFATVVHRRSRGDSARH